jgi:hypothetical protein
MAGPKFTPWTTVPLFERLFPDDDGCRTYLVARRGPTGDMYVPGEDDIRLMPQLYYQ